MSHNHRSSDSDTSILRGQNTSLVRHMREYIGELVTIFTTSGGASGFGYTGVMMTVNSNFIRLITEQGMAPVNPLVDNIFGDADSGGRISGGIGRIGNIGRGENVYSRSVGSVVDIPVDRIAAFTHNAI